MAQSISATTVVWNGTTWSASNGCLINVAYSNAGTPVPRYCGSDEYPQTLFVVDKACQVVVTLGEFSFTGEPGDGSSNLVATLKTSSGSTSTTFANMVLVSVAGGQDRSVPSECVLTFEHVSGDGSTSPVS